MLQKTEFIWFDGKLVPWDQAQVHVLAHGLHYGTGVFEGIRASAANCGWSTMVNQDSINAATLPLFSKMLKNCNQKIDAVEKKMLKMNEQGELEEF